MKPWLRSFSVTESSEEASLFIVNHVNEEDSLSTSTSSDELKVLGSGNKKNDTIHFGTTARFEMIQINLNLIHAIYNIFSRSYNLGKRTIK